MTVRLAFAVAAFLEPEILVVDEVLAVGDAEFQKKAIGKMQDVSRNEGRTVLFVSHNMTAIENLCPKLCILKNGILSFQGKTEQGIALYLRDNKLKTLSTDELNQNDDVFHLTDFEIKQSDLTDHFLSNQPIIVSISYNIKQKVIGLRVGFELIEETTGIIIFRSFHDENRPEIVEINKGEYNVVAIIPSSILKEGSYIISLSIGIHNVRWIIKDSVGKQFNIYNIGGINKTYADSRPGIIMPYIQWDNN
jgi:lipopolysaccharide transport system ATP-binding protein